MSFNPDLIRAISNKSPIEISNNKTLEHINPYCLGIDSSGAERLIYAKKRGAELILNSIPTKNLTFKVLDQEHFSDLHPDREIRYNDLKVIYNKV